MAERNKILFIVESFGGGVFTYLADLSNELIESFDIYIAYAIRKQTPNDFTKYFDARVNFIEVKSLVRPISPIKDIFAFFEIRRIASKIKPQIIHLHSSKAGVIGRFAFSGKYPLFYTPHGYSFLMKNTNLIKRKFYWVIEKLCASRRCITISCSLGEHLETKKLTDRAVFVNNGVNISKLNELLQDTTSEEHKFTVFTLGRICYQKNPQLFNKIAERLPDVKFIWIGDGELRDLLTSNNIFVTGWKDRKNAIAYSSNCDVFLLTSLWEGLPISLLESMLMKKICVVSNVIGNRDVIKNLINGFVCNEVEEYVNVINAVRNSFPETVVENAYQSILDEYNTTKMANSYLDIYRHTLENNAECEQNIRYKSQSIVGVMMNRVNNFIHRGG